VLVFKIVSLKDLNKFLIKSSFPFDCWVKDFIRHYGKSLKTFPFWELTFESSLSKGLNVLAIFRYVVKNRGIYRGEDEKELFCFRVCFERLTFLSKVENRLKRGRILCESFTRKDILNFKERLDDGNLWFLPFLFSMAL
jgi:hypothetical protein